MAAPDRGDWESVWIGTSTTERKDGWFPVEKDVRFNELSVFEKKVTFGPITKDSDDIISSYIMGDLSGGGQIDLLTGADQTRYRHGMIDAASPFTITLPKYHEVLKPDGASGTSYPCYQLGDYPYVIFGSKIYSWDEDTDEWGTGLTLVNTPVGKPTVFNSAIYLPFSSSGYGRVTDDGAGNPSKVEYAGINDATSETDRQSPNVVDFEVWDNKIWAITPTGAVCSSRTGNDDDWDWQWNGTLGHVVKLDSSTVVRRLISYFDNSGALNLYAITDRAAYMLDSVGTQWEITTLQFAPHPDFGRAATVWRPGEDLHIGVGLSKITYTSAGVIDPEAGLNRNDGLPYTNLGTISDLEAETSRLYACVSGSSNSFTAAAFSFDSKWGTEGSGTTNFSSPKGIALDSSGNIFVADSNNDRIQKYNSSGVHQSNIVTSIDDPQGLCTDSSNNIYVSYRHSAGDYRVRKYNSSGVLQWTSANLTGFSTPTHITTDNTHVYVALPDPLIRKVLCSDGTSSASWGSSGSGDGQFDALQAISYNTVTGTIFTGERGAGDRIQEFTTSGTFVRKWGTTGTGDGQFSFILALAVNPINGHIYVADSGRGDIQEFTQTGSFIRKLGSSGSGDGQFSNPQGVVLSSDGTSMWVTDANTADRVQKFITPTTSSYVPAVPGIYEWTGVGWHESWELTGQPDERLTWACVTATSHSEDGYRLWWGCTDENVYSMPLRRTFHNPRAGWQAGYDRFAETGYLISSRFDALMTGFDKKASHLSVFMDNATPTEKVTVSYRVDVEGEWTELGEVTSTGKTVLEFGLDADDFAWGVKFNWIQFRFDFERGSDEYQTPVMAAAVLNYTKIPQQAKTFMFTVPFPRESWRGYSGNDIRDRLADLLNANEYVKLVYQDRTYRGQLAAVAGVGSTGYPNITGGATVNFIEIRTSA